MDWKEKIAKSQELFATAKGILGNPESTAEDKAKVEPMLTDAKAFKAEGVQLKEIEATAVELDTMVEQTRQETKIAGRVRENVGTEFKTFGEMLTAIQGWAKLGRKDDRLHWYSDKDGQIVVTKDLIEAVGASGGFLVPTEFIEQLYAVMAEDNFVRQRATIIPMRRRQVNIPVLDQTGTTANVPHWFGGMTFYWAEEATEKTESDPAFRQIEMVAHKLIGYTRAADELVEDAAISLDALLSGELGFVGGARWHEEYAFLQGTGAGQPLGVIPAGATITVARAADGAIGFADLANMMENFLPTGQGVWIITQSAMADLIQLNGPAGNPSYIWQPNARDGVPGYLLGYPVIWCEKVPRIGTSGDVVLADWRYYLIGDRKAITVESTQFDRWRYDETSWRMVHRVDGQPWLSAPLTYQDGSTQVSPFVILGDKSS
jgi:HK97 family phage major capsid protein